MKLRTAILPALLLSSIFSAVGALPAAAVTTTTTTTPASPKAAVPPAAAPALPLGAGQTPNAPLPGGDPFVLLPGTWDWAGRPGSCTDNPQTFALSDDRTKMILTFKKPVKAFDGTMRKSAAYKILDAKPRWLRTQVEGETRRNEKGELVVYDFVFATDKSFCFHHSDWPKGKCTNMMVRCPGK